MSPPALVATQTSGGTTSAEGLIKAAQTILANCGVPMGPSKVSRLVRQFQLRVERNGFAFFYFLANSVQLSAQQRREALANPDVVRAIAYADPTGETAVRNVLNGRGW